MGLSLGLATVIAVGAFAHRNAAALYASQRWVAHTHEVIESLDELELALNDAVAVAREHAWTRDEAQHRTYRDAMTRLRRRLSEAYQLTRDNPRQQRRLDRLRPLVESVLAQLDVALHARRWLDRDLAREIPLDLDDKRPFERIRALIDATKHEERQLLTARRQTEQLDSTIAQRSLAIGFGASLCLLIVAVLQILRESAHRAALARENAVLLARAERDGDELRQANRQLVRSMNRARELTEAAETAKAQTEQSKAELLEVAKLRETFIGVLGHDLRNPLASIAMSVDLLQHNPQLTPADELAIGRIMRSSRRMTRMIDQLLDLTRARIGGGFPLEPKVIDLRDVCRNVVEEFAAPIELEIEGDVTGTWDPDRLEEVVSNITGNGIAHATPGTPLVVKVHGEAAEVIVEIRNQGDPIAPEVLPFIFEPFRRAKRPERSPSGNLGLGLYIAKQIVLSHGGTLDACSVDGATTFAMSLPRHQPRLSRPQARADVR